MAMSQDYDIDLLAQYENVTVFQCPSVASNKSSDSLRILIISLCYLKLIWVAFSTISLRPTFLYLISSVLIILLVASLA